MACGWVGGGCIVGGETGCVAGLASLAGGGRMMGGETCCVAGLAPIAWDPFPFALG